MTFDVGEILFSTLKSLVSFWQLWVLLAATLILGTLFKILGLRIDRWFLSKKFKDKKTIQDLRSLTPTQFEEYVAHLFGKLGYKTEVSGGPYDGGIDVFAIKDNKTHYIQCKKYITRQVPVGAVRDFYGAIADKANTVGYFITTHTFTAEAEKFAEDKPLELIDQFRLLEYMKLAGVENVPTSKKKLCPKCSGLLVERRGKHGVFLGCSSYPKCKYTSAL